MGLVDYAGSDSESDQEEKVSKTVSKPPIQKASVEDEEMFFDDNKAESPNDFNPNSEDVLEDIVKPKDWELKLAEKTRRKLEKKAMKKALKKEKKSAKKEKKDKIAKIGAGVQKDGKTKAKVVISALGGLSGIVGHNSSDESDDEDEKPAAAKQKLGHGFLSTLPAPKGRDNRSDGPSSLAKSLVPQSVAKKAGNAPVLSVPTPAPAPRVVNVSDDSDDDDETTDFFGFSSAPKREEITAEVPLMAMNSSMDVVGPSRPTEEDAMDPTEMYMLPEDEQKNTPTTSDPWLHRKITDEQAHKLLMRFSHDIGPEERRSINEMASSLVDVNVDAALGPDVKTNIIKNLGHRSFVEATSAPLPQVQTQGQTSRRKHQITYLASLAVAREEQLKDQWADQKQSKRMARQKYGF